MREDQDTYTSVRDHHARLAASGVVLCGVRYDGTAFELGAGEYPAEPVMDYVYLRREDVAGWRKGGHDDQLIPASELEKPYGQFVKDSVETLTAPK